MKTGESFKASEFFALFLAHALIAVALLLKPELIDTMVIMTVIGADIAYITGRSYVKGKNGNGDVKTELLNILKEAQK